MHLFTLPKWAVVIVAICLWPACTAILIYLLLTNGDYSLNSVLAGVLICIFFKEVKKVWGIVTNA